MQNNNITRKELIELADVAEERQKRSTSQGPTLLESIKQVYYEYCSNTSIHGVQYLGERRPFREKVFWMCVFFVSIGSCLRLINDVYVKWNETPVIVSFSEKSTPVWNIPFPAITVCSETKRSLKNSGFSYAHNLANLQECVKNGTAFNTSHLTANELKQFRTLLHICNTQMVTGALPILESNPIEYSDVLEEMVPSFDAYYFYCKWFSHFGECDRLLQRMITSEGVCYTFNGLSPVDMFRNNTYQYQRGLEESHKWKNVITDRPLTWSLEDGYTSGSGIRTYPARVLAAGSRAGLFIALQSYLKELDYGCRGPVQGFKVILHSPDDAPHVSKDFVRIPMNKEVLISVKPNMITTSSGISNYHPFRRQCFLSTERKLLFFTTYTQGNCEMECLANFTLNRCGCVKFSMPRLLHTPVCAEDKISCYDQAEDALLLEEFEDELMLSVTQQRDPTKCNCLPACTSLAYSSEISQGNFDFKQMLQASADDSVLEDFSDSQMSRLSIYFKENQFITSKRSQLYGITDFLANCGGIFGLFMGFSILSMVEMVYHFSLRLISNMNAARE